MDSLRQDLGFAIRKLAKTPAFTTVAMLSLALGIGANTTIFSLFDTVVLRPLPVHEPDRLVRIFSGNERNPYRSSNYADYVDFGRMGAEAFAGLAAHVEWEFSMVSDGVSSLREGELVSSNYFDVLGVDFALGRGFTMGSEDGDAPAEAVVSYGLWQRAFGGVSDVVGRTVRLTGEPFTIVGVAPRGFRGLNLASVPEIWVPLGRYEQVATGFWAWFDAVDYDAQRAGQGRVSMWELVGRLRPDVSLDRADAVMATVSQRLASMYPRTNGGISAVLVPAVEAATPLASRADAVDFLFLLVGAITFALLIACANVANLTLARGQARRKEMGVRLALGASRRRLVRQLLTESLVLASLGGAVGLLAAVWSMDALASFRLPGDIAVRELGLHLDTRVFAFTAVLSLLTGVVFGLAPALQTSRPNVVTVLKDDLTSGPRGRPRMRAALVALQVGLSLVLLVGAGLFARSLHRALTTDLGFDADDLLVVTLDLSLQRYDAAGARSFLEPALERVRVLPDVQGASVTSTPFGEQAFGVTGITVEGRPREENQPVEFNWIGPDYFAAMRVPVRRGRVFDTGDREGMPKVAVINETMARTFWPGESAVGKRFHFGKEGDPYIEVLGVVADTKYFALREESSSFVYLALAQSWDAAVDREMSLVIRGSGAPTAQATAVRQIFRALDPDVPIAGVATIEDRVNEMVMPQKMGVALLGFFAALAVVLASLGIYGVVSYSVGQRTREIGIRVALGAEGRQVTGLVVREGLLPVFLGIAAGIPVVFGTTRIVAGLLYGISPIDPLTVAVTSTVLIGVALVACILPVRRAMRASPMEILRYE